MKIIKDQISINELKNLAKMKFGDLVKAVVDVKKEVMAVDDPKVRDKIIAIVNQLIKR